MKHFLMMMMLSIGWLVDFSIDQSMKTWLAVHRVFFQHFHFQKRKKIHIHSHIIGLDTQISYIITFERALQSSSIHQVKQELQIDDDTNIELIFIRKKLQTGWLQFMSKSSILVLCVYTFGRSVGFSFRWTDYLRVCVCVRV